VPRRAVLAACVLLAALVLLPASAQARTRAPAVVFGAGGWSFPAPAQLDQLRGHGLQSWRLTMTWSGGGHTAHDFDLSGFDNVMRDAARRHVQVMATVTGCPAWACPLGGAPWQASALVGFRRFVRAVVLRYGTHGTLWREGGPRMPIRYWQVLNEINGADQWPPRPSPVRYARLLRKTASTIRHADHRAKVVLSGLGERMTIWLDRFLPALYRQRGFKRAFDVMAPEGYAVHPSGVRRALDTTRRIMRRYHDGKKPMFVTEMGWSTGGPPFPFTISEAGQAARMKASWRMLAACRGRWHVRRVFWFSYEDRAAPPSADYWGYHNGLIGLDGRAKPAWHTFLKFLNPHRAARSAGRCRLKPPR
jgi:hypothetical protein